VAERAVRDADRAGADVYVAEDYHHQYLQKRGRSTCTPALRAAAHA
jgi:peptide methionine sulfoxide reductase MsrA